MIDEPFAMLYEIIHSGGIIALLVLNLNMFLTGKVYSSAAVSSIVAMAVHETLEQIQKAE